MLTSTQSFQSYVDEVREQQARNERAKWIIRVGLSEDTFAKGAREIFQFLSEYFSDLSETHMVKGVGSGGWVWADPAVEVSGPGGRPVLYGNITLESAATLADAVGRGQYPDLPAIGVRDDLPFESIPPLSDNPYFGRQRRILLAKAGIIDPDSIEDYIAAGGYQAYFKALTEMTQDEIIAEVQTANVRGRGGAGFPAGIKWAGGRDTQAWPKFVVVNSHEGEPNVYKDRRLIESDPHQLLEGIMIACLAIGAKTGYNYIGGEHALAVRRFRKAVADAYALGLLGDNVLGTGKNVHVRTRLGSGAYIAGEEMALIESLEGSQARPRTKPPFPTVIGFQNRPTVLNNAETLSNIPHIINNGGEWYASIGTERSKGTKLVTMQGPTKRTGLVEVEMGMTLHDLVFDVYAGMQEGKEFLCLQTGGVSAGPIDRDMLRQYLVDFDSLKPVGGMLGSGGFVLLDTTVDPVAFALYLIEFSRQESCGKCTPCRLGCPALVEIVDRIASGRGRPGDLELIEQHADHMINLSLCGLGVAAPAPVVGFLKLFRPEFERRIYEKRREKAGDPAPLLHVPSPATQFPERHRTPTYGPMIRLSPSGGSD